MAFAAHQFITRIEFTKRIRWLINLRWIAAAGLSIVIPAAKLLLKIDISLLKLYIGNCVLIAYNAIFFFYCLRLESYSDTEVWFRKATIFVNMQILFDLILLLYLIHFTGGPENPLISFFIFHMVIASILLSKRAAYLQASIIILLYGFVSGGEAVGLIYHYHLDGFIPADHCFISPSFFLVSYFSFALTLYITVYLSTTIIQKLKERESDLEIANIKLEEQDRIKSQYVFKVSHDIRGSIGAIQSCLKVILCGITGFISQKSREMVERAEHRSRVLLHFVQNLLELSELRAAHEIVMQPVVLTKVIEGALTACSPKFEEKRLRFSMNNTCRECIVEANEELMEKLFAEILANSTEYTLDGGTIDMTIAASESLRSVDVAVSDSGIGIPDGEIARIYDDFFRASNAKKHDTDGTGLGLSLVRQIVDVHGGAIRVNSKENRGSTFTVTLPLPLNQEVERNE